MKNAIKTWLGIAFVIFWMGVIFFFSAMTGTESNNKSKNTINKTLTEAATITNKLNITNVNTESNKKNAIIQKLNMPLRKMMHASVYFVLSILTFLALRKLGANRVAAFMFAILIAFIYACTDEYHQTFIAGRTGQFSDVMIDTTGGVIGVIFLNICISIKNAFKKRKIKKEQKNKNNEV